MQFFGFIFILASLCCAGAHAHPCESLLSPKAEKHEQAWREERAAAAREGRPVDPKNLENTSPLYREMTNIGDSPWSAASEAARFLNENARTLQADDINYVLSWLFKIQPDLALEKTLAHEWAPTGELLELMNAHALETVSFPLVMTSLFASFKKRATPEDYQGAFSADDPALPFLKRFGGERELNRLRLIRRVLMALPLWDSIARSHFAKRLAWAIGDLKELN